MKRPLPILVFTFLMGAVVWMALHGRWWSSYEAQGADRYLIDLETRPLWSQPAKPTYSDFVEQFPDRSLPEAGEVTVYHKWDLWLVDLFMIWLVGSLVFVPVSFVFLRRDRTMGVFARVGTGLIASAFACLLLWLLIGGWGPPFPILFAIVGIVSGGIWAVGYARKMSRVDGEMHLTDASPAS